MSRTLVRRTARLDARSSDAHQIVMIIRRSVGGRIFGAVIGSDVVDRRADQAEDAVERAKVAALARSAPSVPRASVARAGTAMRILERRLAPWEDVLPPKPRQPACMPSESASAAPAEDRMDYRQTT